MALLRIEVVPIEGKNEGGGEEVIKKQKAPVFLWGKEPGAEFVPSLTAIPGSEGEGKEEKGKTEVFTCQQLCDCCFPFFGALES